MGHLTIRWIGQGGYLLADGDVSLCIDPYLSDAVNRLAGRARMVLAPFAPEELLCDAVICTHNHVDHVDIDAIPLMKKDGMTFFAPSDAEETLRACGVTNYRAFDEGATYRVGEFALTAVYARHSVPAVGVLVRHNGVTLYFSGDTEYDERLLAVGELGIDVMVICINGRLGNMNVEDAVRLTERISPKVGIPTHYGMFESNTEDPTRYTSRLSCGRALEYNQTYDVKELLGNV